MRQTACNRQRDTWYTATAAVAGCRFGQAGADTNRPACVGPARPHRLRVSSGAALSCGGLRSIQHATTCNNMQRHRGVHDATDMGLVARRTSTRMLMRLPTHEPQRESFCCVAAYCSTSQYIPAWRTGHTAGVLAGALYKLRRGAKCPAAQSPAEDLCAAVTQLALGGEYCRDSEQHVRSSDSDAANGSALHAKLVEASRTRLHVCSGRIDGPVDTPARNVTPMLEPNLHTGSCSLVVPLSTLHWQSPPSH